MGVSAWKCPWQATLLAASILSSCFLLSQGQFETIPVTAEPAMPRQGETVTLKPGTIPNNSVACNWFRGENNGPNLILTTYLSASGDSKGPAFTGREIGGSGCSLQITNLQPNYSGTYTLTIDGPGTRVVGNTTIKVVEKLSKPILSPATYVALENENVTLHCNISSGTAFDLAWLRNDVEVPTKALLSEDKKSLSLYGFAQDDEGVYTCVASNPLGKEVSNPSNVTLAYGPVNITVKPAGVIDQKIGSKLDLLCVADSNPEAGFRWFVNGTDRQVTKSNFVVDSVAWNDGGNYTCRASNTVTNSSAFASVIVKVTSQDAPSGLSGGAIAGIVIGCLVAIILIACLLYFICTRTSLGPGRY